MGETLTELGLKLTVYVSIPIIAIVLLIHWLHGRRKG